MAPLEHNGNPLTANQIIDRQLSWWIEEMFLETRHMEILQSSDAWLEDVLVVASLNLLWHQFNSDVWGKHWYSTLANNGLLIEKPTLQHLLRRWLRVLTDIVACEGGPRQERTDEERRGRDV